MLQKQSPAFELWSSNLGRDGVHRHLDPWCFPLVFPLGVESVCKGTGLSGFGELLDLTLNFIESTCSASQRSLKEESMQGCKVMLSELSVGF